MPGFGFRSLLWFGPVLYNSGAIFSIFVAEAEVWSDFNNNHYSKFCKSRNFVNIQPNFLSARKKKDQPLRLVYIESKIVSVRASNIYSFCIRIKSFILRAALRRSVSQVCGAHLRVIAPEQHGSFWKNVAVVASRWQHCVRFAGLRFEPQTSRTREERVILLDHLNVAKVCFCLALN